MSENKTFVKAVEASLTERARIKHIQTTQKSRRKIRGIKFKRRTYHLRHWLEMVGYKLDYYEIKALKDIIEYRTVGGINIR